MSAQKTISNSFTVTTMESPVSVQAQYAPNNNPSAGQIHNVWQDGDLYMRTRETDSNVWSSWHKIVGESGDETDFSFGISAYKTTANATTAPSDISSWSDAPLAVTTAKPYLWAKVQQKSWNESTQQYQVDSTSYIRLTGDDGVSYCIVFTKSAARVNENNVVTAELAGYAYKYVGGVRSALTSTTIRYGYILTDSDTYTTTTTNSSGFFDAGTWFDGDDITDYGKNSPSIFAAIVIDGTVVHAEMITISVKGNTGQRGKVGRFFYYAGTFNVSDTTTYFIVNDAQSPYFLYNNNYWVYNPENNPSGGHATMSQMGTPSSSSSNWKVMTSDFKYIITEAIFGNYAHFGSAIINGDWMISTNGTINGVESTTYTSFDADHPNDNTGSNFIPYYCVNLRTGETYQNKAVVRGVINATAIYQKYQNDVAQEETIDPSKGSAIVIPNSYIGNNIYLPSASSYDYLTLTFYRYFPASTLQTIARICASGNDLIYTNTELKPTVGQYRTYCKSFYPAHNLVIKLHSIGGQWCLDCDESKLLAFYDENGNQLEVVK